MACSSANSPATSAMTPPLVERSKQAASTETPSSRTPKFSKKRLALAFAIAGLSDAIGAFATPCRRSCGRWILGRRCCCSWCWAGNGCCCRDWPWRRFRAWGCFRSGCWWLRRLLSWGLLGRNLISTEPHHRDRAQARQRLPGRDYSALMFAARITLPHFLVCSTTRLSRSPGEPTNTVAAKSAIRAVILGSTSAALISLLSLSMTSTGVAREPRSRSTRWPRNRAGIRSASECPGVPGSAPPW